MQINRLLYGNRIFFSVCLNCRYCINLCIHTQFFQRIIVLHCMYSFHSLSESLIPQFLEQYNSLTTLYPPPIPFPISVSQTHTHTYIILISIYPAPTIAALKKSVGNPLPALNIGNPAISLWDPEMAVLIKNPTLGMCRAQS
jgi:hypothetical protein